MQIEFPNTVSYNRFTEIMQSKLIMMTMYTLLLEIKGYMNP